MTSEEDAPSARSHFTIVDVTAWTASHQEDMGSKPKVWLRSPSYQDWLFKYARDDPERAEDWPEKVAAELARVLGIPAATVELAGRDGRRGVISLDITQGLQLVHGNELLFARDPSYQRHLPRPDRGYTLAAVAEILDDCATPPGWPAPGWSAFDVFAGYLVLDALIANPDRHHENWAVLVDPTTGDRALAPSFDHASSLGFNLTDADRRDRLTTADRGRSVHHWASRGRSHLEGRPSLVELAGRALLRCTATAAAEWLERVHGLHADTWDTILAEVPESRLSYPARTFASEVLSVNRGRLLDACSHISD